MPETPLTFIKGDSINSESDYAFGDAIGTEVDYRDSLPINMEAIDKPVLGAAGYMHQTAGLRELSVSGGGDPIVSAACFGAVYNSQIEKTFRIFGSELYIITFFNQLSVSAELVADINAGGALAFMPYSFNSQAILSGVEFNLYNYDTQAVTQYDMSFNGDGPVDVVWIDGYYFFTNGEYLYHTFITDETQIDPLAYNGAELFPDPVVGLGVSDDNKVIVFGRYSIEFFQNAANPEFAFTRLQSRQLKIGLYAKHMKCNCDGNWYFIGSRVEGSVGVYVISGGSYKKVSTREVDKIIERNVRIESLDRETMLEARVERDKKFVILHIAARSNGDGGGIIQRDTLCFSVNIAAKFGIDNAWSYLTSSARPYNSGQDQLDQVPYYSPWNARFGVYDNGVGLWTYGSKTTGGQIVSIDYGIATHYDDEVEWRLDTPFYALEGKSIDEIEIETAPGWTQTNDASVFMSLTYNGVTHTQETIVDYGQMQQYGKRFIRRRLGYIRDWFSIRLRGVSKSRVLFGAGKIKHD